MWQTLASFESPQRSQGYQVTTEVTLAIQLPGASASKYAGIVDRLSCLGGQLIFWIRDIHGTPSLVRFKFQMEAQRDSFLAAALDVPGVSLVRD